MISYEIIWWEVFWKWLDCFFSCGARLGPWWSPEPFCKTQFCVGVALVQGQGENIWGPFCKDQLLEGPYCKTFFWWGLTFSFSFCPQLGVGWRHPASLQVAGCCCWPHVLAARGCNMAMVLLTLQKWYPLKEVRGPAKQKHCFIHKNCLVKCAGNCWQWWPLEKQKVDEQVWWTWCCLKKMEVKWAQAWWMLWCCWQNKWW